MLEEEMRTRIKSEPDSQLASIGEVSNIIDQCLQTWS